MQSTFGKNLRITIDGGSHEESIGVTIEGFKEVPSIDMEALQRFMDRRAPGRSPYATRRREPDIPELVSRDPLRFIIRNTDRRSGDYKNVRHTPRPGHADYTAYVKYHDRINMAGGGPFSARMTAPLCIAGGIALQQLARKGIHIGAHIYAIHGRKDVPFDPLMETLPPLADPAFPVLDPAAAPAMKQAIEAAMRDRDSVGGIVEAAAVGLPAGLGGPMYDGDLLRHSCRQRRHLRRRLCGCRHARIGKQRCLPHTGRPGRHRNQPLRRHPGRHHDRYAAACTDRIQAHALYCKRTAVGGS